MFRLPRALTNTWLFPRYIGLIYIEPALRQASIHATGVLLDIGCGLRRYEPIFKDCVAAYIGLDWPQLAERARFDVAGDALHLPFQSQCFDTVLATELMEHLPDPNRFLSEVARVIRPGGALIVSVPLMEPLHEEPRDYYRFTLYSLKFLLEQHHFIVMQTWSKGGWWSVVLGSFVNQALYDWATPLDKDGRRRYRLLSVLILPVCAMAQFAGYMLDKVFINTKYTLGYVVVAKRSEAPMNLATVRSIA